FSGAKLSRAAGTHRLAVDALAGGRPSIEALRREGWTLFDLGVLTPSEWLFASSHSSLSAVGATVAAPAPPAARAARAPPGAPAVSGVVREAPAGTPIGAARVTVVDGSGNFVDEARTATDGTYRFAPIAAGSYAVGASALRHDYNEKTVTVTGETRADFALG